MYSRKFKAALIVCGIAFGAVLFLLSPFFHVTEVIISGLSTVNRDEVYERLEIENNTNVLFFNQRAARDRIMENLYVSNVEFTRNMGGRLYVEVHERRLAAFIEHMPGTFLYIDELGRVLEVRTGMSQPLPLIVGLNFTHFTLGEVLEVPDRTAFNIVSVYAQLLYRHGLVGRVTYVNVSDTANTRILVGYLEFNIGDARDAEDKVRNIVGILDAIPDAERTRGFVDLRDNSTEFFLTILT